MKKQSKTVHNTFWLNIKKANNTLKVTQRNAASRLATSPQTQARWRRRRSHPKGLQRNRTLTQCTGVGAAKGATRGAEYIHSKSLTAEAEHAFV